MENKRYAGVDIGSGSARIAICELENGKLKTKYFELFGHSLGKDNKEHGKFTEETIDSTLITFSKILDLCAKFNVIDVQFSATEAIRAASNSKDFLDRVKKELNIEIRILNEQEEASFAYLGAKKLFKETADNILVMDIGRGSIELALGSVKDELPREYVSHKLGTMVFKPYLDDKDNLEESFNKIALEVEDHFKDTFEQWNVDLSNSQLISLGMSLFTYGYIHSLEEHEMVKGEGIELTLDEVNNYAFKQLDNLKQGLNYKEFKGVLSQGDIPVLATLIGFIKSANLTKVTLGRTRIPQGIAQQLAEK
tara:strand:- start:2407 stop:3333 length:927 start_codon:yes stop_codon:yes gene_type:complete